MLMKTTKKITLPESEMPQQWYNILPELFSRSSDASLSCSGVNPFQLRVFLPQRSIPASLRRSRLPAPESTHAIALTIREALKAKEAGREEVILFNLSGHGLIDLATYDMFLNGEIQ